MWLLHRILIGYDKLILFVNIWHQLYHNYCSNLNHFTGNGQISFSCEKIGKEIDNSKYLRTGHPIWSTLYEYSRDDFLHLLFALASQKNHLDTQIFLCKPNLVIYFYNIIFHGNMHHVKYFGHIIMNYAMAMTFTSVILFESYECSYMIGHYVIFLKLPY